MTHYTSAIWSPDGTHLAYTGGMDMYQKIASGAGSDEVLLKSDARKEPLTWSRD